MKKKLALLMIVSTMLAGGIVASAESMQTQDVQAVQMVEVTQKELVEDENLNKILLSVTNTIKLTEGGWGSDSDSEDRIIGATNYMPSDWNNMDYTIGIPRDKRFAYSICVYGPYAENAENIEKALEVFYGDKAHEVTAIVKDLLGKDGIKETYVNGRYVGIVRDEALFIAIGKEGDDRNEE